jgi:L,D-transpeptidase catalytic domain
MRLQHILYATLCAGGLALPCASTASANILISINQGTQRMLVSVDGVTRYDWRVSTGRAGHGTPNGVFKINRMDAAHHSKEYDNAFMPDSMFFDLKGDAIHGFNDIPHLGMAVSHGCVRLAPANAAVLFGLVKQQGMANTTVQISGRIPTRYPMVARQQAPTQEAYAGQPTQLAPQGYAAAPGYGRPVYGQPAYGQPAYGQSGQAFPPQPPPYGYSQPYGGQAYYQRYYSYGGGYARPAYRQY